MSSLLQCVRQMQAEGHDFRTSGLAVAKRAVELLQAQGLHAAIAGGYVRDLVHEVEPKDIDVVVCTGFESEKTDFIVLKELSYFLSKLGLPLTIDCHEAYLGEIEGDERLSHVLSVSGCDLPIDFIFYVKGYEEGLVGILKQFDCNLNQYAIVDGEFRFLGEHLPTQGLVFLAEDLTIERKNKMTQKWEAFYGKGN